LRREPREGGVAATLSGHAIDTNSRWNPGVVVPPIAALGDRCLGHNQQTRTDRAEPRSVARSSRNDDPYES